MTTPSRPSSATTTASPIRRRRACAIALALGTIAFLASPAGRAAAQQGPTPTPATPTPTGSPCVTVGTLRAEPAFVPVGATVAVTASARISCVGTTVGHHIVFVLDSSGSMAGEPNRQLMAASRSLVQNLRMGENPSIQVGVVIFNSAAKVVCQLTNRESQANACIGRLAASGGSCVDCGLLAGLGVLRRGRASMPEERALETMIVVSDGPNNGGCPAVLAASQQVRDQGVRVFVVCLGSGCDRTCMAQAASEPAFLHPVGNPSELTATLEMIRMQVLGELPAGVMTELDVRSYTLHVRPAPGMRIVDGSQSPAVSISDAGGLTWNVSGQGSDAVTVTFRVRPEVAGDLPVVAAANGAYVDVIGRLGVFTFDVPRVVVASGGALPTATPDAQVGIRTHSLRLSPDPSSVGERHELTYGLKFLDALGPLGSHVMVVADASGSMAGEPIEALKAALRALVASLPLGVDPSVRVGLTAFDGGARVLVDPTDQAAAIEEAILRLGASGGSCLDCGLAAGRRSLADARPGAGYEDLVLVADGLNAGGCDPVLREARAAKDEGITVHTLCLAAGGCDTSCLADAASPGHDHVVPSLEALPAHMDEVAAVLASDRRFLSIDLTLHLPPHLRLVPDSAAPPPRAVIDASTTTWRVRPVPRDGIALSAMVEAVADGAGAVVMDAVIQPRTGPVLRAAVEAAHESVRTATPPSPTPSAPVPTSAVEERVYLPVAWRLW